MYQGPLPAPETLEKYKNACPSFPERVMKVAENHNSADVDIKKSISFSNTVIPILGQIFTFLLGAGSLLACVYLASIGLTGGAIAVVMFGFSPILLNALKGFRQLRQNNE